ncbi:MAG: alpha/beta hydrolase family protein [Mycobacteriales bacterium]
MRELTIHPAAKVAGIVVLVVTVLAAGYGGYALHRRTRAVTLPTPAGPYAVGRTELHWTDPARRRPLTAWLWYPADRPRSAAGGGATRTAPYVPGRWGSGQGGLDSLAFQDLSKVRTHAYPDAPVAARAPARLPVVAMEPGYGMFPLYYQSLTEDLASRGYLVAEVIPTGSNFTVLAGDRVDTGGRPAVDDRLAATWAADLRSGLDQLLAPGGRFAGRADPARVGLFGHSFGGASALEACRQDTRCRGAADLDGTLYGPVWRTGLDRPVLLVGAAGSCVAGGAAGRKRADADCARRTGSLLAHGGEHYVTTVPGTKHLSFADIGLFWVVPPLRLLMPFGAAVRAPLATTSRYLAAFFGQVLGGRPAPVLARIRR